MFVARLRMAAARFLAALPAMLGSVIVHLAGMIGAAVWVITAVESAAPDPLEVRVVAERPTEPVLTRIEVEATAERASDAAFSLVTGDGGQGPAGPVAVAMPTVELAAVAATVRDQGGALRSHFGGSLDADFAAGLAPLRERVRFFGVPSSGEKFVFLVDMSGSMTINGRFDRCRAELIRTLKAMKPYHQFYVVFFNGKAFPMPDQKLRLATEENFAAAEKWINEAVCNGGTNPLPALAIAYQLKPDAMFLLSDGAFDPVVLQFCAGRAKAELVPVNTIALESQVGAALMTEISVRTGGQFRFVP